MTDRPYHHGNLRQELLEHAWTVVERDGAEGLSLRGISREIGVSHGSSARHFREKQELLDAIAAEGFTRMNTALAEAAAAQQGVEGKLRASGLAYVAFAVSNARILDVMYDAKHRAETGSELNALSHTAMASLTAGITAAQATGEVRPGDPEQLALIVFAHFHGVATLARNDLLDGTDWHDAATLIIDAAWNNISTAPPASTTS